jgi:hypothetical protein
MIAHVLDASWTHRRLGYPASSCTSAELLCVSPSEHSLMLRGHPVKSWNTGVMLKKPRGFGGWPPTTLNHPRKNLKILDLLIDQK